MKLIEHSLPLEAINAASAREKSIRHGHPSTLHLWWARRPLAACRAVLFAQLVDDPSAWPARFPGEDDQARERRRLHKIIEEMVEWPKSDRADRRRFADAIAAARWEIARSVAWNRDEEPPPASDPQAVLAYLQKAGPPVYDPFCGGGSIPLEAQRLGLRAYGSDLNPVAVLITKALIEFPPKFAGLPPVHPDVARDKDLAGRTWQGAEGLAEDVRRYGRWMRDEAEKRIGHLYPKAVLPDGSEATVIAWLWARTVASPDPAQKGAHVPLASSFVLSSKKGRETIVVPVKDPDAPDGWRFTIKTGDITPAELTEAKKGTKTARGSNFICVLSGNAIAARHIKAEGKAGRIGARLMAVVAEGTRKRMYLAPTAGHAAAARVPPPAAPELEQGLPDDPRNFWTVDYGLSRWIDLFTPRQLTALTTFSDLVSEAREKVRVDARKAQCFLHHASPDRPLASDGTGPAAYADSIVTYIAFAISKMADRGSSICTWFTERDSTRPTFARQSIPMSWDFAELNTLLTGTGSFSGAVTWTAESIESIPSLRCFGSSVFIDAPKNNYPTKATTISTDPPYYDNIGYSDLADFFYVWLRRCLKDIHPDLFRRLLTPKAEELVATPYRHGGVEAAEKHFMDGISGALMAMREASADAPLAVYYAFKQAEAQEDGVLSPGWAAFLQAIVQSGLQVDGTWPLRTELSNRMIASGANALASSVVLVCRRRPDEAPVATRQAFLRELKPVMKAAIEAHQKAGVPLPDRRQAAIGPGIGVFSKYAAVRAIDDREMSVAEALAIINKEIDAVLSEGTEALDAETRFALDWYALHGMKSVKGGAGSAIGMLLGFNLSEARMNRSGLFRARGGEAKLLSRAEMQAADPGWRPGRDETFTIWEMAQHLARVFLAPDGGIDAAGALLAEKALAGPDVLLLAERLFDMATARGEAEEALVWNQLQTAWPEIERAADRARTTPDPTPAQTALL
jgi:putative DNA methylase